MTRLPASLAALVIGFLGLSAPALSAGLGEDKASGPAQTVDMAYEIYMGGVTFGKVDLSARFQGSDYNITSSLETAGVVNRFWQSTIQASSSGTIHAGGVKPALYDAFTRRSGNRTQQVTVRFNANGPISVDSNPVYSDKLPVTDDEQKNTLDPVSAMVFVTSGVTASAANPCGKVAPVYDGRRRYNIELSFVKKANVKLDNGLYSGQALVCEIKYVQIAGFKQKILEEGRKLPQMFAWLASVKSVNDPSRQYLIPLRLWADTPFGLATAVATRAKIDGLPLGESRRAELVPHR